MNNKHKQFFKKLKSLCKEYGVDQLSGQFNNKGSIYFKDKSGGYDFVLKSQYISDFSLDLTLTVTDVIVNTEYL